MMAEAGRSMPEEPSAVDIADLVARHHQVLYGYAYRLSGSAADAEDLVQQTFLIAQQKSHQIRNDDAARSWLFTVLRNCFLKDQRRKSPLLAENLELDLAHVPQSGPPEEWFDREQLQRAISQLPVDFRVVLLMFYFEQCSYREIAEKLEMPIGTVMSRLSRAKQHLRSRLDESSTKKPDDTKPATNQPATVKN